MFCTQIWAFFLLLLLLYSTWYKCLLLSSAVLRGRQEAGGYGYPGLQLETSGSRILSFLVGFIDQTELIEVEGAESVRHKTCTRWE